MAERIFGLLPTNIGSELRALWEEFEELKTPEAKYVKALDRFLPMMSNLIHKGENWHKLGISEKQVVEINKPHIEEGSPEIWKFVAPQIDAAVEKGHLPT